MKYLKLLTAIILLGSCANYFPTIESPKADVKNYFLEFVNSVNEYDSLYLNNTDTAYLSVIGDTITTRYTSAQEMEIKYIFDENTCAELRLRFSCLACLNLYDRKWLFKGSWRQDEQGYLYNYKDSIKASISVISDCPYLYEVKIKKTKSPLKKSELEEMKKVNNRLIGTRQYLLH